MSLVRDTTLLSIETPHMPVNSDLKALTWKMDGLTAGVMREALGPSTSSSVRLHQT